MTTIEHMAREVQRHYPRIYIACHVDHRDRRGQRPPVTARDQTILAHVPEAGIRPQTLAAHLKIVPSTLSAALKRLVTLRLTTMAPDPDNARAKIVRLTDAGRDALSQTSVLELSRVKAALAQLSAADRAIVVRGMALLADAALAAQRGD